MTISAEIIERALAGVVIVLNREERELKLEGDQAMVSQWIPEIRKNKNAPLDALSYRQCETEIIPLPCRDCRHLEILEILGSPVLGCLNPISEGECGEGWKRLPEDIKICTNPC